jgi:hypothetical protein
MIEQRKVKRTTIDRPVIYIGIGAGDKIECQGIGRALDISPNGMMMESTEPVYADKLRIRFSTEAGESLEVGGQLIYSMPHSPGTYRIGLMFTGMSKRIADFIAQMCR